MHPTDTDLTVKDGQVAKRLMRARTRWALSALRSAVLYYLLTRSEDKMSVRRATAEADTIRFRLQIFIMLCRLDDSDSTAVFDQIVQITCQMLEEGRLRKYGLHHMLGQDINTVTIQQAVALPAVRQPFERYRTPPTGLADLVISELQQPPS